MGCYKTQPNQTLILAEVTDRLKKQNNKRKEKSLIVYHRNIETYSYVLI